MGYVYRYTDVADSIIKYVGIVWSDNRTLEQRIREHEVQDEWCFKRKWIIEYIEYDIHTRTDAEYIESHLISLYKTDNYYNKKKSGWGISEFLPHEYNWILFRDDSKSNESNIACVDYGKLLLLNKELISENNNLKDKINKLEQIIKDMFSVKTNKITKTSTELKKHQTSQRDEVIRYIYDNLKFKTHGDKNKGSILSDKISGSFYMKKINGHCKMPVRCDLYHYGKRKQRIYFDSISSCINATGVTGEYIKRCMNGEYSYIYMNFDYNYISRIYSGGLHAERVVLKFSAVTPMVKE